jgi:hypothetical protein
MTKNTLALLAAAALFDAAVIWGIKSADVMVVHPYGVITTLSTVVGVVTNVLFALALLLVAIGAGSRAAWSRFRR